MGKGNSRTQDSDFGKPCSIIWKTDWCFGIQRKIIYRVPALPFYRKVLILRIALQGTDVLPIDRRDQLPEAVIMS